MERKSLPYLTNLHRESRQLAVIGLGSFGRAVCSSLHQLGYKVLATDLEDKKVTRVLTQRLADYALQLDSTEPEALQEAGIYEMDTVVVAIGKYLAASLITTLNLKEAGVEYVIAKASSAIHAQILQKVGADLVVFPEQEAGCALAETLTQPAILKRFELARENSIIEVLIPEAFHHKTLAELKLRNRYGVTVLALGDGAKFLLNPDPRQKLSQGWVMLVMGSHQALQRLPI